MLCISRAREYIRRRLYTADVQTKSSCSIISQPVQLVAVSAAPRTCRLFILILTTHRYIFIYYCATFPRSKACPQYSPRRIRGVVLFRDILHLTRSLSLSSNKYILHSEKVTGVVSNDMTYQNRIPCIITNLFPCLLYSVNHC